MIKIITMLSLFIGPLCQANDVKTIYACDNTVSEVMVSHEGTVLDFPIEPEKVILGTKNSFSIEYVKSDLALSPILSSSRSNLFVYLYGRRFTFKLTTSSGGKTVYYIKDCEIPKPQQKKPNVRK